MKIEDQVCTLEQAKKLKELGVEQISLNWWKCNDEQKVAVCGCTKRMIERHFHFNTWYSAYTVSEFGLMIGKGTLGSQHHWQWLINCVNSGLSGTVAYNSVALAGFVITIIEAGVLPIEDINQRLNQ